MTVKITNPRIFHGNRMQKSDENKSGRSLRQFNEICRFRKLFQKYPCEPGISLIDARCRLFWSSRDIIIVNRRTLYSRAALACSPAQSPGAEPDSDSKWHPLFSMILYRPVKQSKVCKFSCVARSLVWVCVHPQLTACLGVGTYANAAH